MRNTLRYCCEMYKKIQFFIRWNISLNLSILIHKNRFLYDKWLVSLWWNTMNHGWPDEIFGSDVSPTPVHHNKSCFIKVRVWHNYNSFLFSDLKDSGSFRTIIPQWCWWNKPVELWWSSLLGITRHFETTSRNIIIETEAQTFKS